MMNTVVMKFGGSSVADNIKLNVVAEKIISFKEKAKNILVVVSAQGKTTDGLIKDAEELSAIPTDRELDMLISTGEQVTASKLSILLNRMGHKAISLTGWQVGIRTNSIYGSAKIEEICTKRINSEFQNGNIVIVAGFQGINEKNDITTLGRGGSDTTAVALQAALNADRCYIFSDVDGIYSADPNMVTMAKKLNEISFDEMQEISDAGAKVLHNRCVKIADKFKCDIELASTFNNNNGTKVCKCIETAEVKSIIKNEKLVTFEVIKKHRMSENEVYDLYQKLLGNNVILENFKRCENQVSFRTEKINQNKVREMLEKDFLEYEINQKYLEKLTIVGYGIVQDNKIILDVIEILKNAGLEIFDVNVTQNRIEVILNNIDNVIIEELHQKLIK